MSAGNQRRPEPAPLEVFKADDTLAKLLRAVENTNVAFELQQAAPKQAEVADPAPIAPRDTASNIIEFTGVVGSQMALGRKADTAPAETPPRDMQRSDAAPETVSPKAPDVPLADTTFTPEVSSPPASLIPLLSVSEFPFQNGLIENPGSTPGPSPLTETDAIDWQLDGPLFKAPATLEDPGEPILDKIDSQLRKLAPKVVVNLVDRLGESIAWLWDEPIEEVKQELEPHDPRRNDRLVNPPLIAHYWTGGPPRAHKIADLSSTGLYLLTKDRWRPGTRILITLQRVDQEQRSHDGLAVEFMIVRWGVDGLGGVFIPSVPGNTFNPRGVTVKGASKAALENFVQRLKTRRQNLSDGLFPESPHTAAGL